MTIEELQAQVDKKRSEAVAQLHELFKIPENVEHEGITKFVDLTIAASVMNLILVIKQTGIA